MKENRKDTGSTDQEDDKEEVRGQKKGHEKRAESQQASHLFCRFNNKVKQRRKSWTIKRKEKEVKRDLSLQKRKEQLVRSP